MKNLDNLLKDKKIIEEKILQYGFQKKKNGYEYCKKICDEEFEVMIHFSPHQNFSKVMDLMNEDEYLLADVQDSVGEFVGRVREAYENVLQDVFEKCSIPNVFQSTQAIEMIQYIKEKYGDELEFLWKRAPDAAIWRNKGNQKWYGVLMRISERKLGINSDKMVDIIDLRCNPNENIFNGKTIFPGYHMNKKSWMTIKLDGTMSTKEIYSWIEKSYELVRGTNAWFLPTNPRMFDIISYIDSHKEITWHKALNMQVGDFVYIYVGAPYSAIMYQCKIIRLEPSEYKKNEFTMEVLQKYSQEKYSLAFLKEYGLNTVRWARNIPKELSRVLK